MKNKLFSAVMVGTMIMGTALPVCAATTETVEINQEKANAGHTEKTTVTYSQASTFTVTIPKTIVLDGETKASDYTVNVKGDISSDKQVKVAPDTAFKMVDQADVTNKKADVDATVTQDVTIWTSEEVCKLDDADTSIGTDKTGNVEAGGLTSGSWKGTFNFDIAMENVVVETPDATE